MPENQSITDRLTQAGVFWWDASQRRVFEFSDNLLQFLGLDHNPISAEEFSKFLRHDDIDLSFRKAGLGESEWRLFLFVKGREYCLRCVRLLQYDDAEGVHHSVGSATFDTQATRKNLVEPSTTDNPISIFDGKAADYYRLQRSQGKAAIYDLIVDMTKAFRAHFPPDIMVSVWMKVGDEFLCVAVAGKIMTALRQDLFRMGVRRTSKIFSGFTQSYGVHMIDDMTLLRDVSNQEVDDFLDAGWRCGAVCPVRTVESGEPWGVVSCISNRIREWRTEERQRLQLLSDSLSVLLAQSKAYSQVFHNLVMTQLACEAGGFFTWQWDVKSHKRSLLLSDGTFADAPYDLSVHHDDYNTLAAAYYDVEQGRTPAFRLRVRLRMMAGSRMRWYEVSAKAVTLDDKGVAEVIVGVARDVDEVVRAEQASKREIEQRFEILDKMPAVIALCDSEGKQKYLNARALEVFGIRSIEDREGVSVFSSPLLTDEQKNNIRTHDTYNTDFFYDFKKVAESGYFRTHRTDVVEMNLRSSKLYTSGVMTGYLLVFTDLSLVAVQKKRLSLFNGFFAEIGKSSKLGVCQFGPGGFASAQWNINLGIDPLVNPSNKIITTTSMSPIELDIVNEHIADLYAGRIKTYKREVKVNRADGVHIVSLHFSYSDSVDAVTAISVDVTESHEREAAIVRALRKSEQVESLRSKFFNNVSHELRTPLNSIVGFSDLIAQTAKCPEFDRYISIIRQNNALLLSLVDGIMELSQLQSGNRLYNRKMVDIDTLISDVHERMDGLQKPEVRFLAPHEPRIKGLKAPLDAVATSQILCKLIANSFHFTSAGCVMLWATAEGDNVIFHVSDTGVGIPPEKTESIFDVFVKVDEFGAGAGLGLPVCRELARQMGGDVFVESTPGRGSHFWLTLPLFAAETADKAADRPNIVVLPHNRAFVLTVSLLMPKCNVFRASRNEFSKMWMENRPHLSIIDVRECPDVVIRFVENIRAFGDPFQVLVVNTPDSGISEDDLLKAGASAIVTAPLTDASLAHVISRLTGDQSVHVPSPDSQRIIP